MDNFNGRSNEEDSTGVVGAVISDGAMAGLIGGILGSILPIMALLTGNSDMASLGFFVNILLYFATGILAGYLSSSRGVRCSTAIAAVISGIVAGLLSGAAIGLAFSRDSVLSSQLNISISWGTWSIFSAIGAGFAAPLTAWIPGFFTSSDHPYRKIRFAVTMVAVLLMFAIYLCGSASR